MDIYQYISLCAFGSQRYSGNARPLANCWCLKQFCSGAGVWEQVFAVTTFPIYVVQRLDVVRIPVTTNGYISIYLYVHLVFPQNKTRLCKPSCVYASMLHSPFAWILGWTFPELAKGTWSLLASILNFA